ncbi:hypothetical protein EDB80DRAFT_591115, partial [Ilyonectria destructans]
WLLIAITAGLIVARMYLRVKINRQQVVLSDVFICLVWCCSVTMASLAIAFAKIGVLRQDVDYALKGFDGDLETMQHQLFWIGNFPFYAGFYLSKAAILALYEQLFPPVLRKRRFMLWMTDQLTGHWLQQWHAQLAVPTRNLSLDIKPQGPVAFQLTVDLVFILPFLILHRLRLRPLVKISVYCTFVLGIIKRLGCPSIHIPRGGTRSLIVKKITNNNINNINYISNLFKD